jgi:hypothetical protein
LGFKTPLHHEIAEQESRGVLESDILRYWSKIEANVVYDVGGYNGLYGLFYAKAHPEAQVTIFEPDFINHRQILENIRINSLLNCKVEKVAISDKEGKTPFSQGGGVQSRRLCKLGVV